MKKKTEWAEKRGEIVYVISDFRYVSFCRYLNELNRTRTATTIEKWAAANFAYDCLYLYLTPNYTHKNIETRLRETELSSKKMCTHTCIDTYTYTCTRAHTVFDQPNDEKNTKKMPHHSFRFKYYTRAKIAEKHWLVKRNSMNKVIGADANNGTSSHTLDIWSDAVVCVCRVRF